MTAWEREKAHVATSDEAAGRLAADASAEELLSLAGKYEAGLVNGRADWRKACELYQRAAGLGNAEAFYRKGRIAEKRLPDHVDPADALSDFEKAAEGGYADAFAALARLYSEGRLAPVDAAKSAYYVEKGIEAGSADAKYLKGAGLVETPNGAQAGLAWLTEAANAGNADAQHTIARLLLDGGAAGQDMTKAEAWLRLAAENGSDLAKVDLASQLIKQAGDNMPPEKIGEIVDLLLSASAANNARASHYLSGFCFRPPRWTGWTSRRCAAMRKRRLRPASQRGLSRWR